MENALFLKNAYVLDGTGAPGHHGSILIRGGRIAQIGEKLTVPDGARTLDCTGMLCTPGFIDVHTHSDVSLLACGDPAGHVMQGITSEVIGNCGYSLFPLRDDASFIEKRRASLSLLDTCQVDWDWRTWPEYRRRLAASGVNVNIKSLIGYGSVRAWVMDYADRAPDRAEQAQIDALLDDAFASGICGLSVGLGYAPDFYADTEELIRAAQAVKRRDRIFAFHIRGERLTLFKAIGEVIRIALVTGVRTQISHLKCAGVSNHGHMGEILEMIEQANCRGADITFDMYPYTAGSSYLGLVFPPKYHEGGLSRLVERLQDNAVRRDILRDMEQGTPEWSTFIGEQQGENLLITSAVTSDVVGKTVAQLGRLWGVSPCEAAARLMVENAGVVEMVMFMCRQEDVDLAAAHPLGMYGSDGIAMDPVRARLRERPHPRYYGSFPTLLRDYGRSARIPLEQLIHKMTGIPAKRFGFADRGQLRPGTWADVCLFRLEDVEPCATYEDPNHLAQGMQMVLVNGVPVVENGAPLAVRPGKVL